MYERFTDRARRVMQLANQEAHRLGHEYLGTEHILLGLVAEGSGVAANVLANLNVHLLAVREQVDHVVQRGTGAPAPGTARPQTPQAKQVIDFAIEEARALNHNYVGTEHLLLGLSCEPEGPAADVLRNFGLKLDDLRAEVLNLLGYESMAAPTFAASVPTEPEEEQPEPEPTVPTDLTWEQLRTVRERIQFLNEQKESLVAAEEFERAAECRDEVETLKLLLEWYQWAGRGR